MQTFKRLLFVATILGLSMTSLVAADDAVRFTDNADFDESYPAWSPDGTQILYVRGTAFSNKLFRQDYPSGAPQGLSPNNVLHPNWLPSGDFGWSRLNVIWILASNMINQISSPLDGADPDEAPSWHPTESLIAIHTKFGDETDFSIGTVTNSGGVTVRITTDAGSQTWPDWSPDGNTIAYRQEGNGGGDIYTVPKEGGSGTPLVAGPANETQPEWFIDGKWLAYASDINGNFDIFITDGTTTMQVTDDPGNDLYPTWSPDGKIAFSSDRAGTQDIWIIDVSAVSTKPTSWSGIKKQLGTEN